MTTTDSEPHSAATAGTATRGSGTSFLFSSPHGALRATGARATAPDPGGSRGGLVSRVAQFLQHEVGGSGPAVVVGAVPFSPGEPAHLVVPEEVHRAPALDRGAGRSAAPVGPGCRTRPVPEPQEYERGVVQLLDRVAAGEMSKVVLARTLEITAPERIDVAGVLDNLAAADPASYTFAVDVPPRDPASSARTFLGASPELLVSREGLRVRSNPMAGSRPRSDDPVEDRKRAEELAASDKDLREHAAVVDAVAAALRPYCRELVVPEEPSVISTAAMWHLATEVTGELHSAETSSLELATALHPTPAVCGTPVEPARAAIEQTEPFRREYYAGMVGWTDADGDGEWVVAIRSADVEERSLRLYAGAGIVAGSDPADERAETAAKFRTALSAMGLDGAF